MPFTWYFVLFAVAAIAGYLWLQHRSEFPDSAYKDILILLLTVALWTSLGIICLGWLSVAVSYFYFKWMQRKSQTVFRVGIPDASGEKQEQSVSVHISPVLKPLLGFIRIRLNYDVNKYSDKFSLVKPTSQKFFSTVIEGVFNWNLPEIKEYKIERAVIYFEDFFQFFSFALSLETSGSFHTRPQTREIKQVRAFPRKTEDTVTRIEELKKVEGELINYKNFESNDDVRRIVWKIYAKNKELVVRIPEILDPYASHIYFYASFHTVFDVKGNEVAEVPFLNFYKTICWSVYKQLTEKNLEMRFVPDQDLPLNKIEKPEEQVKYSITASSWHTENDLKDYVRPKDASVVMISSFSDLDRVRDLIEKYGNEISFVFVPLSECLKEQGFAGWVKWLFVQEEKNLVSVYRTKWSLSLLRQKIQKNENEMKKLLNEYQKSTVLEA
jgi:hypothetical protein